MGRINYLIRLIIRILFVVMCFAVTFIYTAIGNYRTDEIDMTGSAEPPYCTVTTKNGAVAQCTVEDGKIVLDIEQNGGEYDDIIITLKTAPVKYDTSYLEMLMGDKPEYAEYIEDMKEGPWSANLNYRLMSDSIVTKGDQDFTVSYRGDVFTRSLSTKVANTNNSSDDLIIFENDEFSFDIAMGASSSGPLPAGRYRLFAEFNISGLFGQDNQKLSLLESIPGLLKTAIDSLKTVEIKAIFNVSSWLTFYLVTVIFGGIFFLYPDVRSAFIIATSGKSNLVKITYYIYINGCCTGEATDYVGYSESSFLGFIPTYLFMLITVPIRIIAQIINCIIRIIRGDDYEDCDPLYANILGSIGVYAVITAVIGLINSLMGSGGYTVVIASGIVGVLLLIVANILSHKKESEI